MTITDLSVEQARAAIAQLAPGMAVGHANPELADWRGTITPRRNGTWWDRFGYVSVKWHEGTASEGVPLEPGLTWMTATVLTTEN